MIRSVAFFVQRFVLGRHTLLVDLPEFDLELRVAARDDAGRHLYRDRVHAPEVTDFLARGLDLQPGDLVFDIGASIGWYTMLMSRVAPRGTAIHAFEPDPWMLGLLQENASRNRAEAITIVAAAAGDRSGAALLRRYGHRRRNGHGLKPPARGDALGIEMVRLDDYCRAHDLEHQPVGFIKIGVAGFEHAVLRGAGETLGRCRMLLTEFSPVRLQQADTHPVAMLDLLVERGFAPAVLEGNGPRDVERDELLAGGRLRQVLWTRPAPRTMPSPPDPDALAI